MANSKKKMLNYVFGHHPGWLVLVAETCCQVFPPNQRYLNDWFEINGVLNRISKQKAGRSESLAYVDWAHTIDAIHTEFNIVNSATTTQWCPPFKKNDYISSHTLYIVYFSTWQSSSTFMCWDLTLAICMCVVKSRESNKLYHELNWVACFVKTCICHAAYADDVLHWNTGIIYAIQSFVNSVSHSSSLCVWWQQVYHALFVFSLSSFLSRITKFNWLSRNSAEL